MGGKIDVVVITTTPGDPALPGNHSHAVSIRYKRMLEDPSEN
jgi:hypothetical protein